MIQSKIPCKNCLLIPICRQRPFISLYIKCSLFNDFLYNSLGVRRSTFSEDIHKIHRILKPRRWKLLFDKRFNSWQVEPTKLTGPGEVPTK